MKNYYEILGLDRSATATDIKKAYRSLSRKYHPDIAGKDYEDKFKEVNAAYEVLSDPEKKQLFDAGIDPNNAQQGGPTFNSAFGNMSDIFGDFFQAAAGGSFQSRTRAQRGQDMIYRLDIDLKDVVFGCDKSLEVSVYDSCGHCSGLGSEKQEKPKTCQQCQGTGMERHVVNTLLGNMMTQTTCHECNGAGTVITDPCTVCHGTARVKVKKTLTIPIPAGIEDGMSLCLRAEGDIGVHGGGRGDVYVEVHVREHKRFARKNNNLHCWIAIPMTWAVLGHTVTIETFDGEQEVVIPESCQYGQTVTLENLGICDHNNQDHRGSIIVHINISMPTHLSSHEYDLLEEFAQSHDTEVEHVEQGSQPIQETKKGFFSKLKDALL